MNERITNEPVAPVHEVSQERELVTRRGFLRSLPFVALAVVSTGCYQYSEQSNTTKVGEGKPAQDFGVTIETPPGRTNVELFTSKQYGFDRKQTEVTKAINDVINSGTRNISEVQTSYTEGYLTAGRANYSPDSQGKGNGLRVRLIQSSKHYWDIKDTEVKRDMEAALKDTQNVHKVNTIFQSGYLVAAEVWYFRVN